MRKQRLRVLCSSFLGISLLLSGISGCSSPANKSLRTGIETVTSVTDSMPDRITMTDTKSDSQEVSDVITEEERKSPKYVFLFIGDGMSYVQANSAQVYLGNNTPGEVEGESLNFTRFPVVGNITTYDATSFCPDSASAATAISCGIKTLSGVIGLEKDKLSQPESITEIFHDEGMKIGIVSTVTINHATPAAFYSHVASRSKYYEISMQLARSGFEYFGGGSIKQATGADKSDTDAYSILEENGYTIADTKEEILALSPDSGKCYAVSPVLQDSGSVPYSIDAKEGDLTFLDYVETGIRVLDNENGFFMMCESGKIDWSCHANDAMSTIREVIGFADGIQAAIDFAKEHPDDTLILVMGDHETGGMTIGYAGTGYHTYFDILSKQKMSYFAFEKLFKRMKKEDPGLAFQDILPVIKDNFGLLAPDDISAEDEENTASVMTDSEFAKLETAFAESMIPEKERTQTPESALLYGDCDPLTISVIRILNHKAGIGWTTYSHTGSTTAVYAMGTQAELFGGSYDNTDIFNKLLTVMGLKDRVLPPA